MLRVGSQQCEGWRRYVDVQRKEKERNELKRGKSSPARIGSAIMALSTAALVITIVGVLGFVSVSTVWAIVEGDKDAQANIKATESRALDACRHLVQVGWVLVAYYSTFGSQLVLGTIETSAQKYASRYGALLRPAVTGATMQRMSEVTTCLLAHTTPGIDPTADGMAVVQLRSLMSLDVRVVANSGPSAGKSVEKFGTLTLSPTVLNQVPLCLDRNPQLKD